MQWINSDLLIRLYYTFIFIVFCTFHKSFVRGTGSDAPSRLQTRKRAAGREPVFIQGPLLYPPCRAPVDCVFLDEKNLRTALFSRIATNYMWVFKFK